MTNKKVKASQHENYAMFTIIAILLPIAGFVLGIVYLTKEEKLDRKLGEHALALSVLFGLIGVSLYYALFMPTEVQYYPYSY